MKYPIAIILFLGLIHNAPCQSELHWEHVDHLNFQMEIDQYHKDRIYFFHAVLENESDLDDLQNASGFSLSQHAKPLDIFNYWENREHEHYHILFTKTAYVVDCPVDFFTKERLSDLGYLESTMPEAKIHKRDSAIHIAVGFGSPDIDYTLDFKSEKEMADHFPVLHSYFLEFDGLDGQVHLNAIQHNFKYSRVLFQKTSKMSVSVSRYFSKSENQTLVLNYTLNYIYNMPPGFIGGSEYLVEQIKKGIKALIEETQNVAQHKSD